MKEQLELFGIFDATSSFKYFWDTKILSNEPKFNGSYARNNFAKIKDATYVTNLDVYKSIRFTPWYFDSFKVENIPKEI